ncbi:hypothetical protein N5T34_01595 [Escherichia coli]|uniref:hypothetical protein n=1 Tax=Escherichia coli TaxID=562 RepID=UPI00222836C4|nr:hypothetical protein [Escherichia coli]MCW3298064.1 hypothetical protein [Escherichia coli]
MSNKYEDLIKNARMNADCGEHMSPAEVTTLLNVVETTFSALAAENALLKKSEPAPFSKLMMEALDVYQAGAEDLPELAMLSAYKKLRDGLKTPATDAFLAEVRAQESKRVYESILDNPAVTDMVSLVDWLEQNANDSVAFAVELRKGVQP